MILKKSLQITVLSMSLLTLAGCSTFGFGHKGANNGTGANGAGANGATASGAGDMSSFGGQGQGNANPLQVGNQSYYFDFNASGMHDADLASIKVQANYLNAHADAKVLLTGNTDERGSREYNIGLGERRAQAVESALEAYGVNQNQITTVSYGAEKPVALGHDEDSWVKNRRVDLIYQTAIK